MSIKKKTVEALSLYENGNDDKSKINNNNTFLKSPPNNLH